MLTSHTYCPRFSFHSFLGLIFSCQTWQGSSSECQWYVSLLSKDFGLADSCICQVVQCQNITMGVNHCFSILKILHQAAGLCKPASESLFSIKPVFVYVTELLSVHAQPPRANANGEIPQATSLPTGWAHPLILKEFVSHLRAAADRSPYNEETVTGALGIYELCNSQFVIFLGNEHQQSC